MYLAGHRVVPSRGRIEQRRRSLTLWLRAMLRCGTLGIPRIYLHLHLHSHPLAISNGPAQNQQQQSSGGQSMLYVFLSICGQSAAALHCPSNLICKGLFGSTRCLPRLASHQRPELLLVHCSAHYPLQLSAKRPVTAPTAARAPQHLPAHRLRLRLRRPSKSQLPPFFYPFHPLPPLFSLFPSFSLPDNLRPDESIASFGTFSFEHRRLFDSTHRHAPLQHLRSAIIFLFSFFLFRSGLPSLPRTRYLVTDISNLAPSPSAALPNSPLQVSWPLGVSISVTSCPSLPFSPVLH
ncbi:hypothetical protein M431DRAFT_220069 [Trichoderma harzianum CBS 226.95]|uniref:Uncharacterized protein n=1 Tax=Trichoderma harzianum CBS 226.95 TaxID=983964 RepID=A0A2T4A3A4_TRIHA|nr:hypothetical protein M431DRAFT_220069 [Trichoderma harzianum CBS 226.95]PTB51536.1 hypothetical protein M431DRAFT_220069 [Trichoderma harzianum CBS 226.95]